MKIENLKVDYHQLRPLSGSRRGTLLMKRENLKVDIHQLRPLS